MQLRVRGQRPPSAGPVQPPAGATTYHPATQDQAATSQTPNQPEQAYPFAPPQAPPYSGIAGGDDSADQPLPAPAEAGAYPALPPSGLPAGSYHADTIPPGEINAAPTPTVTTTEEATDAAGSGSASATSSAPPTLDRPRSSPTPPTE
jgi:hypothetical protein